MEKNLEKLLLQYLNNFDEIGAYEINEYFNSDFGDEYDNFALDKNNLKALNYLNDEFIDIDIEYYKSDQFDAKVKNTLKEALDLLKAR